MDFETYYYKVRRKITKDAYTEQELFTALSDADGVKVHVPKPEARAELNKDGNTVLTMDCKKDFVSGFDIYRKSGELQKNSDDYGKRFYRQKHEVWQILQLQSEGVLL